MPKRTDIKSILVIGAGPIVIGQACEFDYSGVQACKALKDEGYRVILVNSNPATIMTDPGLADATYIEPITPDMVARIIEKEKPDAVLPTMGGQTALNCALDLVREGVLEKFDCELIGASRDASDPDAAGKAAGAAATTSTTTEGFVGPRAFGRLWGGASGVRFCGTLGLVGSIPTAASSGRGHGGLGTVGLELGLGVGWGAP